MLSRLPGTAAVSFLLDQGVFKSQRLPLHCAFVSCTTQGARVLTLVKPHHSHACAVQCASSTTCGRECSSTCAVQLHDCQQRQGFFVCTELIQDDLLVEEL